MRKIGLIIVALFVISPASAQNNSLTPKKKTSSQQSASSAANEAVSLRRKFWFSMAIGNFFDTNISHDEQGLNSFGVVPSFAIHFRNDVERPSFEANYEVALHRYTATDEYDRVSQNFDVLYRRQLMKRLYARTIGAVSLKGSSEDREVNNNYILEQQLQYRITPAFRVSALAAYRVKRYDEVDRGSNAIDSYLAAKLEQRFSGNRRLEFGYRYDHNCAQDPRNRYLRRTYAAEFTTPLSRQRGDALLFELRYSPRAYTRRLIKVDDERVARRDQRWVFDVTYERALKPNLLMASTYSFEKRDSNDVDKRFTSSVFGITFTFDWWR